ncbi:MAG TPA: hypothetical protein VLB06_03860, partial [Sulfuricaulis sp.]|nr:hypothetical protein [Sulfuricaulis sp.]
MGYALCNASSPKIYIAYTYKPMNCKVKFEHFPLPTANAATGRLGMTTERQVLLGLEGGRLDERVLVCAANLCQRVHAGLEVLLISDNQELPARLARFFGELRAAGIGYRFFHKQGDLGWEIVRYVKTRKNIAFVVVESLEGREGKRGQVRPWRLLACPVVEATAKPVSHFSKRFYTRGENMFKKGKGKQTGRLLGFGALTAALYWLLFYH